MDPVCKNPKCGLRHPAAWNCARAAFEEKKAASVVVHAEELVVHDDPVVVHSKHGVYKDLDKRKMYRRKWMRDNRK